MRYAIIVNDVVTNVILWDGQEDYQPSEECELIEVDEEVSIGWFKEGGVLVAPPEPEFEIPEEDPTVVNGKLTAVQELVAMGVSEATARTIVGLPPLSE